MILPRHRTSSHHQLHCPIRRRHLDLLLCSLTRCPFGKRCSFGHCPPLDVPTCDVANEGPEVDIHSLPDPWTVAISSRLPNVPVFRASVGSRRAERCVKHRVRAQKDKQFKPRWRVLDETLAPHPARPRERQSYHAPWTRHFSLSLSPTSMPALLPKLGGVARVLTGAGDAA